MTTSTHHPWNMAEKAPFEAFGILYYPVFRNRADLPTSLDDEDMAWAVTAGTNLTGTGYALSQPSVLALAAYHHAMADLARTTALLPLASAAEQGINPLADLQRLVPDVTASPMYPDFPAQVMELSEAQFRYDQMCHYLSTYGVEEPAGMLGLNVSVGEGWLPKVDATPKTRRDETLVAPKVLHLLVTVEDLQSVVAAQLARATRMHPAAIEATLLAFAGHGVEGEDASFPKVAFHENMMELIRRAAEADSGTLERVAVGLAQHPGDLLKATLHLLGSRPARHLATRQKKGLCRAFEHFDARSIARNLADAGRKERLAPNYLSVARFGGPHLRQGIELVETGQVRSWTSELEALWDAVREATPPDREGQGQVRAKEHTRLASVLYKLLDVPLNRARPNGPAAQDRAWRRLLAHYGERPGVLLRSLARLLKGGCPVGLLRAEVDAHALSYSLPTLVRTLTLFSQNTTTTVAQGSWAVFAFVDDGMTTVEPQVRSELCTLLESLVRMRLRRLETPLKGRRVYLDTSDVSLEGSLLMPNETGGTGTAWPPVGIAFDLPRDKTVRFFTYWDERRRRVDVDLHFIGRKLSGESVHIGWDAEFGVGGLVTSGDVTTSHDSVEFLDANLAEAAEAGIEFVVQQQHIYFGADDWKDISTCYSGALLVGDTDRDKVLYNPENLLFRDDLTGGGSTMTYAVVNVPGHYVRIVRGAKIPLGDAGFSLKRYLEMLFEEQGVTPVGSPDEADLCACVGRSDDPQVVSLFDESFYLG